MSKYSCRHNPLCCLLYYLAYGEMEVLLRVKNPFLNRYNSDRCVYVRVEFGLTRVTWLDFNQSADADITIHTHNTVYMLHQWDTLAARHCVRCSLRSTRRCYCAASRRCMCVSNVSATPPNALPSTSIHIRRYCVSTILDCRQTAITSSPSDKWESSEAWSASRWPAGCKLPRRASKYHDHLY